MQKSPDHKEYKNGRYTNDPALLYETSKVAQARPSGAIPVKPENTGQATQNSAIHFLPTEFFVFHISKLHNNFKQKCIKRGLPPVYVFRCFRKIRRKRKTLLHLIPHPLPFSQREKGERSPSPPAPLPEGEEKKTGSPPFREHGYFSPHSPSHSPLHHTPAPDTHKPYPHSRTCPYKSRQDAWPSPCGKRLPLPAFSQCAWP